MTPKKPKRYPNGAPEGPKGLQKEPKRVQKGAPKGTLRWSKRGSHLQGFNFLDFDDSIDPNAYFRNPPAFGLEELFHDLLTQTPSFLIITLSERSTPFRKLHCASRHPPGSDAARYFTLPPPDPLPISSLRDFCTSISTP